MKLQWFQYVVARPTRPAPQRLRRALGPSPLRRLVQAGCLAGFLWLVFYVSWPYSAVPARSWTGLTPIDVDAETGQAALEADRDGALPPAGARLVLTGAPGGPAGEKADPGLGRFEVVEVQGRRVKLKPVAKLSAQQAERLALSVGPLALHERGPGDWPSHYADDMGAKEAVPAELFLQADPLAALAARAWCWALAVGAAVLLAGIVLPRVFCGYLCPLGTLIDATDWVVATTARVFGRKGPEKRCAKPTPEATGRAGGAAAGAGSRPIAIRYVLLAVVLGASLAGAMLAGTLAAIPLLTRGLVFLVKPFHDALARGWHNVPPLEASQVAGVVLLLAVLSLAAGGRRLWCRLLCPSGALLSLTARAGLLRRRVSRACTSCGRCRRECAMNAIGEDFSTRAGDCISCQACGGVCPAGAISFEVGHSAPEPAAKRGPDEPAPRLPRRGVLRAGAGLSLAAASGAAMGWCVRSARSADRPVRPPGSVEEEQFLRLCIRCGQCFRACPNDALQPMGLAEGVDHFWTPALRPDWSGCEPSCANCGRVCPTGAIRPLPLEDKRKERIGLAVVDVRTCLPHAQREACRLCVDECRSTGYDAIEFINVGTRVDDEGRPIEGSGFLAPVVRAERCTGCGLCQTRCRAINVAQRGLLQTSAIMVEAGRQGT